MSVNSDSVRSTRVLASTPERSVLEGETVLYEGRYLILPSEKLGVFCLCFVPPFFVFGAYLAYHLISMDAERCRIVVTDKHLAFGELEWLWQLGKYKNVTIIPRKIIISATRHRFYQSPSDFLEIVGWIIDNLCGVRGIALRTMDPKRKRIFIDELREPKEVLKALDV